MLWRAEMHVDGPLDAFARRTVPVVAHVRTAGDSPLAPTRERFVGHVANRGWPRPGVLRLDIAAHGNDAGRAWADAGNSEPWFVELVSTATPGRIPRLELLRCYGIDTLDGGRVELHPIPGTAPPHRPGPHRLPTLPPRPRTILDA